MDADLATQIAIRARLVASQAVTDLVPANNIIDTNGRPAPRPSIVLGEVQMIDDGPIARNRSRVFHTVHVWQTSQSREGVKIIMGHIKAAIMAGRLDLAPNFHCADYRVSNTRARSDPDGESAHGTMTIEVVAEALT